MPRIFSFLSSGSSLQVKPEILTFDLYARRIIRDLEGTENLPDELLAEYANPDSEKHKEMVDTMRKHLQLTTLKFQRIDDLVESIGLPKCKLCTHCWDNSSYVE